MGVVGQAGAVVRGQGCIDSLGLPRCGEHDPQSERASTGHSECEYPWQHANDADQAIRRHCKGVTKAPVETTGVCNESLSSPSATFTASMTMKRVCLLCRPLVEARAELSGLNHQRTNPMGAIR